MINLLRFYFSLIFKFRPLEFKIYTFFSTIAAIFQTIGIISIFPLVALFADPLIVTENILFQKYYFFAYENERALLIQLSSLFLLINTLGILIFIIAYVYGFYLSQSVAADLKNNLHKKIFKSSNLVDTKNRSNILNFFYTELGRIQETITSTIDIFQAVFTLCIFIISILLVEPKVIYFLIVLVVIYSIVFFVTKKKILAYSIKSSEIAKKINQITLYLNLALKDTLVLKLGDNFVSLLKKLQRKIINMDVKARLLINCPRFLFEIILYSTIVLLLIFFIDKESLNSQLPFLSLIAILVYKSIPIFFNIYRLLSTLNKNYSAYKNYKNNFSKMSVRKKIKIIESFNKSIVMKNLIFSYTKEKRFKFNLVINKKDKLLIQGKSGNGKSTLLNLITGLLKPDSGSFKIDNLEIFNKSIKTSIFGYVTQNVILFPGTLAENICISNRGKFTESNLKKLKLIYDICGLNNIVKSFNEVFDKVIEFDSPELSGGQKQRIGIARTLFMDPEILILDEATSSLDRLSELEIFKNILNYYKKLTLVAVSHRPIHKLFNKKIKI